MYKTQPTMTGGCQCGAVRYALFETRSQRSATAACAKRRSAARSRRSPS